MTRFVRPNRPIPLSVGVRSAREGRREKEDEGRGLGGGGGGGREGADVRGVGVCRGGYEGSQLGAIGIPPMIQVRDLTETG